MRGLSSYTLDRVVSLENTLYFEGPVPSLGSREAEQALQYLYNEIKGMKS